MGYKICLQFSKQIHYLYIYQLALFFIISIAEVSLSFLLNLKFLLSKTYFEIKFIQLLIYSLYVRINYNTKITTLKRLPFTINICASKKKSNMI